jgi:hypothetical protein
MNPNAAEESARVNLTRAERRRRARGFMPGEQEVGAGRVVCGGCNSSSGTRVGRIFVCNTPKCKYSRRSREREEKNG